MTESDEVTRSSKPGKHLMIRFLAPIAAGAASAAASYAVAKGPELIAQKVLPRLREAARGAGDATHDLPARLKSAAEEAGELTERLTERARAMSSGTSNGSGRSQEARSALSHEQLETRRKTRAEGRARRRSSNTR
jgi:hypothetical protein